MKPRPTSTGSARPTSKGSALSCATRSRAIRRSATSCSARPGKCPPQRGRLPGVISRRDLLVAFGALTLGCSRRDPAPATVVPSAPPTFPTFDADPPPGATKLVTWTLPERGAAGEAAVLVPDVAGGAGRWPLVVALHGHGEAMKAPPDGAMG